MRLEVIDWDKFRALLAEIVADKGTQQATAGALDITQPHLSRLLNTSYKSDTVSSSMLARIQKALVAHKSWSHIKKVKAVERLWRAVMSPEADTVYWEQYVVWLNEAGLEPFDASSARCKTLFNTLAREYPKLLRRFADYSELKGFDDLAKAREKKGIGQHRIQLARYRIVEPLLAADDTGGVERSVAELREAGELEAYLRAAVKREELLLKREGDHVRAQKIAAQQTSTKASRRW